MVTPLEGQVAEFTEYAIMVMPLEGQSYCHQTRPLFVGACSGSGNKITGHAGGLSFDMFERSYLAMCWWMHPQGEK